MDEQDKKVLKKHLTAKSKFVPYVMSDALFKVFLEHNKGVGIIWNILNVCLKVDEMEKDIKHECKRCLGIVDRKCDDTGNCKFRKYNFWKE